MIGPRSSVREALERGGSEVSRHGRAAPSVALGDLCRAVRAHLAESGKLVLLNGRRVVAAALGAVSDELTVAPALRCSNVPDVLIGTLQTKRWLGAELFCHRPSLGAALHHARDPTFRLHAVAGV